MACEISWENEWNRFLGDLHSSTGTAERLILYMVKVGFGIGRCGQSQLWGGDCFKNADGRLCANQSLLPVRDEIQHGGNVQRVMEGGIFLQVGPGESKERHGGTGPVFLDMHECTRELDEALV